MRYLLFFIIVSLIIVSAPSKVWSEDMYMQHMKSVQESVSKINEDEIENVGNTICPVMGREVDKNVSFVYEGKRYYFCCPRCIGEFKKDPEKYIKNISPLSGTFR